MGNYKSVSEAMNEIFIIYRVLFNRGCEFICYTGGFQFAILEKSKAFSW